MEIRSIDRHGYEECLEAAAKCLVKGNVVCFPTETFYALGARYDDEESLLRISLLKGRPATKTFSLVVGDIRALSFVVSDIDSLTQKIIRNLWPSALTVVFGAREGLSPHIRDERNTVAVRMPDKSFALDLAKRVRIPVTATSANHSGLPPARSGEEVIRYFPEGLDLLIDGDICKAELPSTIIEVRAGKVHVLREGVVPASSIYSLL
jgi:L-threonylcarbamoyladenylate synthase